MVFPASEPEREREKKRDRAEGILFVSKTRRGESKFCGLGSPFLFFFFLCVGHPLRTNRSFCLWGGRQRKLAQPLPEKNTSDDRKIFLAHLFTHKVLLFCLRREEKKSVQKISITDEEGALRLIELYRMLLTQV